MHKKVFDIWEWRSGGQAEALNEQSKSNITVLSKAEAKEREAKAHGKDDNINNLALEKQGESDIMPVGHKLAMAENGDVQKYDVEADPKSIEAKGWFDKTQRTFTGGVIKC